MKISESNVTNSKASAHLETKYPNSFCFSEELKAKHSSSFCFNEIINKICTDNFSVSRHPTSFVDKLSDEQITTFINMLYPSEEGYIHVFTHFKDLITNKNYIYVTVENSETNFIGIFTLGDYSSNLTNSVQWIKYMKNVFGTEYVRSFLKDCASIFDED